MNCAGGRGSRAEAGLERVDEEEKEEEGAASDGDPTAVAAATAMRGGSVAEPTAAAVVGGEPEAICSKDRWLMAWEVITRLGGERRMRVVRSAEMQEINDWLGSAVSADVGLKSAEGAGGQTNSKKESEGLRTTDERRNKRE